MRVFLCQCLLWFASLSTSQAFVPATEILLLYNLYNQTDGDHWHWRSSSRFGPIWNFSHPNLNPCSTEDQYWQGLVCSSSALSCTTNVSCSITRIDLERYGLRHELPSHWKEFSLLTHLDLSDNRITGDFPFALPSSLLFLDLSDNQLSSSIPLSFGELVNLSYLDLESNLLSSSLPSTIVYLTSLTSMSMYTNRFSGALPVDFGQMISLRHLDIEDNYFSGRIPTSSGDLKSLSYFDLSVNFFTNSIPTELGLMSSLEYFSVELNTMTGSIPSAIGLASHLTSLIFEENYFISSLPSTLSSLSALKHFSVYQNSFTGTLPSGFGSLHQVSWLELGSNSLSGPIFPIGQLSRLQVLSTFDNLLSSSIPCDFNSLLKLNFLDLSLNYFDSVCENLIFASKLERLELFQNSIHGSISHSFFSNLQSLEYFDYSNNFLSGTIPSNLNSMTLLGHLDLGKNRLSGTLPSTLASLTLLMQLYLAQNHLGGSLTRLLTAASNMSLVHLDLSSNMFEGNLPTELFQLPALETLALTSNCFHGSIPDTICDGSQLSVISMDGLGASKNCNHDINFILRNSIGGNIPFCLWNLQNLTVLSLSGNGLTGTISPLSLPPSLRNLTLSHNHLSGSTPSSFKDHFFDHLDLSHNKIGGEIVFYLPASSLVPQRLILEVNRLSGSLSNLPHHQSSLYLNILPGNIFSCNHIPRNDIDSNSYSCGSLVLDEAIISVCVVFGLGILIFILHRPFTRLLTSQWRRFRDFTLDLTNYFSILDEIQHSTISKELRELSSSMSFLQYLEKVTLLLVGLCIVLPLPVYGLRWTNSSLYSTHDHLYRWTCTVTYLTGLVPATLLLISWMVAIAMFIYLLRRMKKSKSITSVVARKIGFPTHQREVQRKKRWQEYALTSIFLSINLLVIGAMNSLYIVSTTQRNSSIVDFWIKICVSIFQVLWNALYVPLLDHSKYAQRLKILTRVINFILIPCITTALSSPSCFQGLLVQPDPITSSYQFKECLNFSRFPSGLICTLYRISIVNLAPFIPSFSYNYMCGSTLLAAYLPVYLYVYTFQLLRPLLSTLLLTQYLPYRRLPPWLRKKFPGVLWPHHWLARKRDHLPGTSYPQEYPLPSLLLNMDNIMTNHMQDLLILLTFGLCCPLLAVVIGFSIKISIWQVRLIIGRFVFERRSLPLIEVKESLPSSPLWPSTPSPSVVTAIPIASSLEQPENISASQSDISLIALTTVISDLGRSYHQILWVLVWSSCVFWAFICWDIGGDEAGWDNCYWLPLASVGYILLIRLVIFTERKDLQKKGSARELSVMPSIQERSVGCGEDRETRQSVIELNTLPI